MVQKYFLPILLIGVIFLSFGFIITKLQKQIETKFQKQKSFELITNMDDNISFPDYVIPEQISWVIRGESDKKIIYAVARPLSTFLRNDPKYSQNLEYEFNGILKSIDNGNTWKKLYEVKEEDIIDFSMCNDDSLYLVFVEEYGGGSGEMFINIASSVDGGKKWFLSDIIAKNDTDGGVGHPFIYGMTSDLITDRSECNRSYIIHRKNFDSDSFDSMIYSDNFWRSWHKIDF